MRLLLASLLCLSSYGAVITPTSYTATPGQGTGVGGTFDYFDETGKQLTDGVLGNDTYWVDLGNGNAYEWVGWLTVDPVLNFQLPGQYMVTGVNIGFNRMDSSGILLPITVIIGNTSFSVAGNEIADNGRGFVTFSGNWEGNSLQVQLIDQDVNRWIFVDEITMEGFETPEPGTSALVAAGGLALLITRFGKKRLNS